MTNLLEANLINGAAVGSQGEGRESPNSFPAYSAYKDSGVEWLGEVPEHWQVTTISRLFEIKAGGDLKAELFSELKTEEYRYPIYTNANSAAAVYGYTKKALFPGGVITVTGRGSVGFAVYRDHPFDAIIRLLVLKPYRNMAAKYYSYLINALLSFVEGSSAINQLSAEQISPYKVSVPALTEQQQVVSFLDHETARIDALIEDQQRLIELLKEKRQAVISHAVIKGLDLTVPMKDSGVEWLGDVPAHWRIGALKHFISPVPGAIKTGPFGSHLKSEDMKEGTYKVFNQRSVIDADFSAGDNFISEEKFSELRGFTAFPGDVLVTTRGTIGRAAILPDDAEVGILHPCLLRIQVEKSKLTSSYLCRLIQESHLLKTQLSLMSNSTTIQVIYSETMANLFIPVPTVREQGQITAFLDDVIRKFGDLTNDANESVKLLQERRSALISAAVTGKIDVRGWQLPTSAPSPELAQEAV